MFRIAFERCRGGGSDLTGWDRRLLFPILAVHRPQRMAHAGFESLTLHARLIPGSTQPEKRYTMSHILITGASGTGKTRTARDTIVPDYSATHDIVELNGSTASVQRILDAAQAAPAKYDASGKLRAPYAGSSARPTLVFIDDVRDNARSGAVVKTVEALLAKTDSSKVMLVITTEPGTIRTHPGKVHTLHLEREHFIANYVTEAAA